MLKGYDNHHCLYKPLDRKWGWSVDDVMPGRDSPENFGILKKSQLWLDHGGKKLSFCNWGIELSVLPLLQWLSFRVSTGGDELRFKTPQDAPRIGVESDSMVSKTFKNCVSLPASRWSHKLIKRLYLKHLYMSACICIYICIYLYLHLYMSSIQ